MQSKNRAQLGIEIWESCTFLGGYYIAMVLIRPRG